jgi:hypothetical protein
MINDKEDLNLKINWIISSMSQEDQKKLAFARYFLNKIQVFDIEAGRIHLESMDVKTFQYFIFSIILEYQSYMDDRDRDKY